MAEYSLQSPLDNEQIKDLRIGDIVFISGPAFTCRSRLFRFIFDEKNQLPFSTDARNILIHAGPIVVKENCQWKLVSFMPTSSIRFVKWGPQSVEDWQLKLICGKTTMDEKTAMMMKNKGCVHVSPQSVSPNLWVDSIKVEDVFLMEELGSIEAVWFLKLTGLGPFVVDIDSEGNNLYKKFSSSVDRNLKKAYKKLNIPDDFEYTKLY